jgi:hypothetical protein
VISDKLKVFENEMLRKIVGLMTARVGNKNALPVRTILTFTYAIYCCFGGYINIVDMQIRQER